MLRSVPAHCGSGSSVGVLELCGELGRRQIAKARMRPNFIEVPEPGLDYDLCLCTGQKPFHAEAIRRGTCH